MVAVQEAVIPVQVIFAAMVKIISTHVMRCLTLADILKELFESRLFEVCSCMRLPATSTRRAVAAPEPNR
jgi:hypothetical protein